MPLSAKTRPMQTPARHCISLAPRTDFPFLHQAMNNEPFLYLDSAATSQKPTCVLTALETYYKSYNVNVHRADYRLAALATNALENARTILANFINAFSDEIIFTRNATEGINLIARSWCMANLSKNDEILVSVMDHHANFVPWQIAAAEIGASLTVLPLSKDQGYSVPALKARLASGRVKLVACSHVSNVLGCVNPVQEIARLAHAAGATVVVDACQSLPHMPVDIQEMGCDFLVGSSHKMLGPTGVGFLWGRRDILEEMPPYMSGGEMVSEVFEDCCTFAKLPHKFEAGTPAIGEIIGLGTAVKYLMGLGMKKVNEYEEELGEYLYERLTMFREVTVYGPKKCRAALCAFSVDGIDNTDLTTALDFEGVAIRSGDHCTQPLHRALGVASTARVSMYVYNTFEEVDLFIKALNVAVKSLGGTLSLRS